MNFFEGAEIGAMGVGHSSMAILETGFLSSLTSGVPTKVVGVTGIDRPLAAELSLVDAWSICVEVEERSS